MRRLAPPVAVSELATPPVGYAVALGRDRLAVAAYTHHDAGPEQTGVFARVYAAEQTVVDDAAPQVAVAGRPLPARDGLALRLTCDERCSVAAAGRVRVGSRAFGVTARRRTLRGERAATIRLVARARSRPALARALALRVRRVLVVRLNVADAKGNRRVVRRSLVVRRAR